MELDIKIESPKDKLKKNIAIMNLCNIVDSLYFYALKLIPKDIEHSLGIKKELLKNQIEIQIRGLYS